MTMGTAQQLLREQETQDEEAETPTKRDLRG